MAGAPMVETAGLVQVRLDAGPVEMALILSKQEAYGLSGDLNGAALAIDRAEDRRK